MNELTTKSFQERIINTHGSNGLSWLNDLPTIIKHAEKTYHLSNVKPLPQLSFNYTTKAIQNNQNNIIVKFCLPGRETDNEIDALNIMRGDSIVQLQDFDRKLGILLLEECLPGKDLTVIDNDIEETSITAIIIKKIHEVAHSYIKFPTTNNWFDRLNKTAILPSQFSLRHINQAKQIADELHNQSDNNVLLHGDLHHFNILSAERQPWLAIDPKGVVGPPEYECGAFLRNPIPMIASKPNIKNIMANRIDIFVDALGFDRKIIIGWGYSQAILAGIWSIDTKSNDWAIFLKCAEVLYELLQQTR